MLRHREVFPLKISTGLVESGGFWRDTLECWRESRDYLKYSPVYLGMAPAYFEHSPADLSASLATRGESPANPRAAKESRHCHSHRRARQDSHSLPRFRHSVAIMAGNEPLYTRRRFRMECSSPSGWTESAISRRNRGWSSSPRCRCKRLSRHTGPCRRPPGAGQFWR